MIKDVRYSGYSANPNEYVSEDGELAMAMNLIPEDGGLKAISKGKKGFSIRGEASKIFTHKPEDKTNYISYGDGKVKWIANEFDESFETPILILDTTDEIVDVIAFGNILVISTSNNMYYSRWDATTDGYIYLGTQVPMIDVDFGLDLRLEGSYDKENIELAEWNYINTSEDDWELVARLPEKTIRKYEELSNGYRLFTSDILEGVTIDKEVEYRFVITHNALNTNDGYNPLDISLYSESGGGKLGYITQKYPNYIHITPRKALNQLYLVFSVFDSYHVTYSVDVYRGNKNIYTDYNGELDLKRIKHTQENFDHITGQIKKFINERGRQNDRFIYPFFVRYAVKLYDGNYSYISPPILMLPNTGYAPCISYKERGSDGYTMLMYAWVATLQYRRYLPKNIDIWKELISGVDIFVSPPIYSYNQGEEFDEGNFAQFNYNTLNSEKFGVGKAADISSNKYFWGKVYTETCADLVLSFEGRIADVEVCPFSTEEMQKKISSVDNYYLIKSYSISEIIDSPEGFVDIELDEGILQSLETRETLKDITSKYSFSNAKLYVYNNRVNLFNGQRKLPPINLPYECNGYHQVYAQDKFPNMTIDEVDVYIHINTAQGERFISLSKKSEDIDGYLRILDGIGWFYYPNSNAYKATIFFHEKPHDLWYKGEYNLKPHDFLDGAYWIGESIGSAMIESAEQVSSAEVLEWRNKKTYDTLNNMGTIYVSEVDNPWIFLTGTSKSIGDGELIGIATASKALSEGQFGAFPLYAFTTEGVWSLAISSDGTFNPAQPITRDVCISADSITQIDQSVLFATSRGVMVIQGSETMCLTDKIDVDVPLTLGELQGCNKLIDLSGINVGAFDLMPFKKFLYGSSMVYDYKHQRIVMYNAECKYAYVYSFETKSWGLMESNIQYGVNSYPEALVVDKDNNVVNLSSTEEGIAPKGLMITRAMKLEGADILKTINTIVQRGNFNRGDVSTILWGSRDLKSWHLIWSSKDQYLRGFRGTAFKYFRIGAITDLDKEENLVGATIGFNTKQTNQIR